MTLATDAFYLATTKPPTILPTPTSTGGITWSGTPIDMTGNNMIPVRFQERYGAVPQLTLQRRGIPLPGLPDPFLGQFVEWIHTDTGSVSTQRFAGEIVGMNPYFDDRLGWIIDYQCLGLRYVLDQFPNTDPNQLGDTTTFNLPVTDPSYYTINRSAYTCGKILAYVLGTDLSGTATTSNINVINMYQRGLGKYTLTTPSGVNTWTPPSAMITDLNAIDAVWSPVMIPPRPVYFNGEKLGEAIDAFLSQWLPNWVFWVQPDGTFRFLNKRAFPTNNTLTMGTDHIEPGELSRETTTNYQRVQIRGQAIAQMALLKYSAGDLAEDFEGGVKGSWTSANFTAPGTALSYGSVSGWVGNTQFTVTPTVATGYLSSWAANYWEQSGTIPHQGTITLRASGLGSSVYQYFTAKVATDSGVSGGTATITIDSDTAQYLTGTPSSYDSYTMQGLTDVGSTGNSLCYLQYKIANTVLAQRIAPQATYPQAFVNSAGTGASLLSSPMGLILKTGGISFPLAFTYYYRSLGTGSPAYDIRFVAPTFSIIGADPVVAGDIWVYLPIYTQELFITWPAIVSGVNYYCDGLSGRPSGTSNTVEGLKKTLVVTIDQWTDPAQATQMTIYAKDLLDSVKDTVVEGQVVYYDFWAPAFTCGNNLSVAGNDGAGAYTTGWEGLNLPVLGVTLIWPQTTGQQFITVIHCSNRRNVYGAIQFLRPARRPGYSFLNQLAGATNLFGGAVPQTSVEQGQAGIDRVMPGGLAPTAGTGLAPNLGYQPVNEGPVGLPARPDQGTVSEQIDRAHHQNELDEARRALFGGDQRLDHSERASPGPPPGETP